MKCYGCGYEKRECTQQVEKVVKYKSGKRKGEIKGSEWLEIDPDKEKEEFNEVIMEKDFDFEIKGEWLRSIVKLFACPKCGTVRIR